MRPFQKNSSIAIREAEATEILWTKCGNNYEIITSDYQIRYFQGTQNSKSIDDNTKDAFAKAYAVCQSLASDRKTRDPYCPSEIDEFYKKVENRDSEDRTNIIIAWRKQANYFITADKELYEFKKEIIEKTLASMWHPIAHGHMHETKIMNPIEFVEQFIGKS